jgi:hypothetical protein
VDPLIEIRVLGAPKTGKSTVAAAIAEVLRNAGLEVAIVGEDDRTPRLAKDLPRLAGVACVIRTGPVRG